MKIEKYKQQRKENEINTAHGHALRAHKLGISLAKRAVKMVEKGKSAEAIGMHPRYVLYRELHGVDFESATMSLNSELKSRNEDIKGRLVEKWDGDADYGGTRGFIEITEIDGQPIDPDDTLGWDTFDTPPHKFKR
jgi:hypothetical protein